MIDAHTHVGIFNDGVGGGHSDGKETTDPVTPHLRALDAVHPEDIAFQDLIEAGQRQPDRRAVDLCQDRPHT